MFYEHRKALPAALQRQLSIEAQEVYRTEFNRRAYYLARHVRHNGASVLETAHRYAWAKVRRQFRRDAHKIWQPL